MSNNGYDGIDFGSNISTILNGAFKNESCMQKNGNVQFLKFASISFLGNEVFSGCTGLKEVYLGDGAGSTPHAISIGENVFYGCSNLEYFGVARDARFSNIGVDAFALCSNLTNRDFFYVSQENLNGKGT
jgi:hypothetical protein